MKNILKKLVKKGLKLLGFHLVITKDKKGISFHNDYDNNLGYEFENDANEIIRIVRKNTMLPYINLVTLYEQVLFCEEKGIEGDYVECGVWNGGAVGMMAAANMKLSQKRRKLHLFDAFEEICAPNEEFDGERAINEVKQFLGKNAPMNGELKPLKGIYDRFGGPGNIQDCKKLIEKTINYPINMVFYHKGWFQNTIPIESKKIDKIAILRLDGDWYESTKICLEYLYDLVVPNGIIIFDDYGLYSGCKKAVDDFLKERNEKYFLNYSTWACRYLLKQ